MSEAHTIDVKRETVAMRLLDSRLTAEDRDFVRAAIVFKAEYYVRVVWSARICELLQVGAREASA